MTQPSLKPASLPPAQDVAPRARPAVAPAVLTAEDWSHISRTLTAAARVRDGDQAARKTEIRRRMRALARAQGDEAD